jgi:hypothetical protein
MSAEPEITVKLDRKGLKILGGILMAVIAVQTLYLKTGQASEGEVFARMDSLHTVQMLNAYAYGEVIQNDNRIRTEAVADFLESTILPEIEGIREDVKIYSRSQTKISTAALDAQAKSDLNILWEFYKLRCTIRAPTYGITSPIDTLKKKKSEAPEKINRDNAF